jgi:DNA (cytosine-5)-methyltransferase 1
MRYATVCSGIEAPSAAWHPLGWVPVFFSEIEAFPSAVLAHHYPDVPNRGDMREYASWPMERLDLLCGGTPCQSFSVAGKRGSLNDERGNLTLVFCRIADRFNPEWIVWENVPGIFSHADNPFGCFLGELTGCDTAIDPGGIGWTSAGVVAGPKRTAAWRVIDAQGFVPQRRERVFVVCTRAGSRHHPADVLFETEAEALGCLGERAYTGPLFPERESLRGDSQESGEAWEGTPGGAARSVAIRGQDGTPQAELGDEVANAILRPNGGRGGVGVGAIIAPTIPARTRGGGGLGTDFDCDGGLVVAPDTARCIATREGTSQDYETTAMVAHSLRADGFDASEDGTGRGTPLVPVAFNNTGQGWWNDARVASGLRDMSAGSGSKEATLVAFSANDHGGDASDIAPTLRAGGHTNSHANAGVMPAIAFGWQNSSQQGASASASASASVTPTLDKSKVPGISTAMKVRRLTPTECARLQNFPDDYLSITYRNKPAADGSMYRALGNSMCVSVMAWIGARIDVLNKGRSLDQTEQFPTQEGHTPLAQEIDESGYELRAN